VVSGDNFSTNLSPLRGGKGYQWEGGIRVPMFIYIPGGKAQKINTPVIGMDFLPTILEMTNTKAIPSQKIDGVSLLPLLNQKSISNRPLFWHYPHYGNQGGEPSSIIQMENFKLIHYWEDGRNELYDLEKDLAEQNNIAKNYPSLEKDMWNKLNNWLQQTNAKLPEIDKEYTAEKEEIYKNKVKTEVWPNQEKNRRNMLKKDFEPNKNWWGSEID
jgi:arylsulfatase A-like enzyme